MMRQLGEMVVEEPVSGSFSHFAYKYWGPFAGFMSGWNYWVLNVLVCMAELSAIGLYIQYWWPQIPTWASALAFFVLINGINLLHVKFLAKWNFGFYRQNLSDSCNDWLLVHIYLQQAQQVHRQAFQTSGHLAVSSRLVLKA